MASSAVSPAMNRRAKLEGLRMPYRAARCWRTRLLASRWKNVFDAAASIYVDVVLMRPACRRQQVLDRPGVVAEHAPFPHAEAAAFDDDNPARDERLGRLFHRLAAARDAEVGAPRRELFDELVDAALEIAAGDRRA